MRTDGHAPRQQDGSSLRHLSLLITASDAHTSLLVPDLDRLFVAACPGYVRFGSDAAIDRGESTSGRRRSRRAVSHAEFGCAKCRKNVRRDPIAPGRKLSYHPHFD